MERVRSSLVDRRGFLTAAASAVMASGVSLNTWKPLWAAKKRADSLHGAITITDIELHQITDELNDRLGLNLTDAFCGFKAYRVSALSRLTITETGYAMPLQLWVQAAHHGLKIRASVAPRSRCWSGS